MCLPGLPVGGCLSGLGVCLGGAASWQPDLVFNVQGPASPASTGETAGELAARTGDVGGTRASRVGRRGPRGQSRRTASVAPRAAPCPLGPERQPAVSLQSPSPGSAEAVLVCGRRPRLSQQIIKLHPYLHLTNAVNTFLETQSDPRFDAVCQDGVVFHGMSPHGFCGSDSWRADGARG